MPNLNDHRAALCAAMNDIAGHFDRQDDLETTLGAVTGAAVDLIDGVDYADVLTMSDGEFRSMTPTDPMVVELDELQRTAGRGPCLEAATSDSIVRSSDLRSDGRWPSFAAGAVQRGVHSILSFQLYTHEKGAGALNLFGLAPRVFDSESETTGVMLATQAAIALITDGRHHQFESALASRDVIGQAKGIIMERYGVDAVAAFNMIRKLSQDTNEKVSLVAQRVIDSR
jgi:transcriptional regulator with GAF, ATPase, and Fis domain